ncbi:MAG: HNH endonuclease [Halobacteriota archaeon]
MEGLGKVLAILVGVVALMAAVLIAPKLVLAIILVVLIVLALLGIARIFHKELLPLRPELPTESPASTYQGRQAPNRPIPKQVQTAVWRRDGGRCVECGSNQDLEYDHIIPVAKGGSNTERNVQLLCIHCNRAKHAKTGGL